MSSLFCGPNPRIMNGGKYILTHANSLVLRQIIQRLVKKYNGDLPCDSLRDACLCLGKHEKILYGLGMTTSVNESSLSRANESRDNCIFEGLGLALIKIVRPMYSKQRSEGPAPHRVLRQGVR